MQTDSGLSADQKLFKNDGDLMIPDRGIVKKVLT